MFCSYRWNLGERKGHESKRGTVKDMEGIRRGGEGLRKEMG
jgi:hypothetical protein